MRLRKHHLPPSRPVPAERGAGLFLLLTFILAAALAPASSAAAPQVGVGAAQGPLGPPLRPEQPPIESPSQALGVGPLHARGITGAGVTVAVVDSGLAPLEGGWTRQPDGSLLRARQNGGRAGFVVFRDFVDPTGADSVDSNGHGTHVVGTIANRRPLKSSGKGAMGVAPGANLVVARALNADGSGDYDTVVAAIDWVIASRAAYNIRVLNLSIYAPIRGPYWADPLGRAVMRAWQAGIVVVAAAGNGGPDAATVTVPGNVPYVISVGAARSPQFTTSGGYEVAPFSARGPTESAFAKPDLLVPAVRVVSPMPDDGELAAAVSPGRLVEKATLEVGATKTKRNLGYYQLSGTSMAAAEVSGLVALLLQDEPGLTNNQVKARLMATARLALAPGGAAAYAIWEQGAGLAQAVAAVDAAGTGAANAGMNIAADLDLSGDQHYWGPTRYDEVSGRFTIDGPAEAPANYLTWAGAWRVWAGGLSWTGETAAWAGAWRVWAGAGRAFPGGAQGWAEGAALWAGAWRIWAGAAPPSGRSLANGELGDENFTLYLPLLAGGR